MAEIIKISVAELLEYTEKASIRAIDMYKKFPRWMNRTEAAEYVNKSKSHIDSLINPTPIDGIRPPAKLKVNEFNKIDKHDLDVLLNTKY